MCLQLGMYNVYYISKDIMATETSNDLFTENAQLFPV